MRDNVRAVTSISDGVHTRTGIDDVGTTIAGDLVIASVAVDGIGSRATLQHIITGTAGQGDTSRRGGRIHNRVDSVCAGRRRSSLRSGQGHGISARHIHGNRRACGVVRDNVRAITSISDGVCTRTGIDDVGTTIAGDLVIACVAVDGIGSRATLQRIVASTTSQ